MAKAYLIRKGYQEEFDRINLFARELGFTLDTNRLLIGDGESNIHIPNEPLVASMILSGVAKYAPTSGITADLETLHAAGTFAYDTDTQRVIYKSKAGLVSILARTTEAMLADPVSIVITAENIDAADSNSVTLTDFSRPTRTVFLNGILCTQRAEDAHRYSFVSETKVLKIMGCVAGDIISYI